MSKTIIVIGIIIILSTSGMSFSIADEESIENVLVNQNEYPDLKIHNISMVYEKKPIFPNDFQHIRVYVINNGTASAIGVKYNCDTTIFKYFSRNIHFLRETCCGNNYPWKPNQIKYSKSGTVHSY